MTDRTPLQTLTLARDHLDSLMAGITPGPWANRIGMSLSTDEPDRMISFAQMSANKHFMLALHAAAPAIRAALTSDIDIMRSWGASEDDFVGIATALLSTPHAAQWITEREATDV